MRWIDIFLPEPGRDDRFDTLCLQAARTAATLPDLQERDGLDAVSATACMAETGRQLFQALNEARPGALAPEATRAGFSPLDLEDPLHDGLVGFQVIGQGQQLDLPWTWLHNGLDFMFRGHPIVVSDRSSDPGSDPAQRPWMMRQLRSRYLVGSGGGTSLPAILPQLEATGLQRARILFVPGHGNRSIRSLIFREADVVMTALRGAPAGQPAARLDIPDGAVTPAELATACFGYQALHYAGPTSEEAQYDASRSEYWMNRMLEEAAQLPDQKWEEYAGMEGEVLGVDPITSLLDDISERYERNGGIRETAAQAASAGGPDPSPRSGGGWLLQDGPVDPDQIGQGGGMPPLVFSNSYLAINRLGTRCTAAGASTFVGPLAPLYSRPARRFTRGFYGAMAEGWGAGTAVWRAAGELRRSLGAEHPAWLSYGILGHGSLALPYL